MNISSVVVQTKPSDVDELVEIFSNCDFCDYHFSDKKSGKIILTIEGEGVDEEIKKIKIIEQTPRVISADMMMAYSEDELEKEREQIELNNEIPNILNDDSIKAEDITYYGDIKKKDI
ncbi:MAG: nitrate reductase [Proteobacteria bacterium]|nr:MAG: nitrate reductase [Pseudomonadota bacterium]